MLKKDIYTINLDKAGDRIDLILATIYEDLSRNQIKKLIKNNNIRVNNKNIKPSYMAQVGDTVEVNLPEIEDKVVEPENIELDIVFEDDDIIIVNKPKGMVVHPAPGNYSGTLVNALLFKYKNNLSDINGPLRPGIVHRIDKDTSGILVVCKNNKAHEFLAEKFKNHDISREYRALAFGNIREEKITIDRPIGRNPKDRMKMAVVKDGRSAITHINLLESYGNYTYVMANLETGRTHQIRVHLSSLGHPIVGDQIYGNKKNEFGVKGQMLHAGLLGFVHPSKGEYVEFKVDLPDYFKKVINKLRQRVQI